MPSGDQHHDDGGGHADRPLHDPGGQPVPEPVASSLADGGGLGAAADRQGASTSGADGGQQGRQAQQGGDRGEDHHGDAGVGEGPQEVEGEHQQAGQRHGHDQPR